MRETIKQSILIYLVLTLVTGVIYPLAITAVAQVAFPSQANGSLIADKTTGKIVGSGLLGQEFSDPKYFWGRLSATSPAYNAAASSGSNLGPLNPTLKKNVEERIKALDSDGISSGSIPVDLVTSSGSGLDPDISVSSALYQSKRIAKIRGLSENAVSELVSKEIQAKQFGCLGEARVNVLKLNIALDKTMHATEKTATSPE